MVEKKSIDKGIFIGNGDWSKLIQSKIKNKINITNIYNSKTINNFRYKHEKYVFVIIGPYLNDEFVINNFNSEKKYFIEKPVFNSQILDIKYEDNLFINNLHQYNNNIYLIKKKINRNTKEIYIEIGSKKKSKNIFFEWAPHVFTILEILDKNAVIDSIREYNSIFKMQLISKNRIKINVKFGYFDKIFSIKFVDRFLKTYLYYDDIKKKIINNSNQNIIKSYPLDISLRYFLSNKSTKKNYKFNSKISNKYTLAYNKLSS